jgi:transcriptional regulator with XRE-family HTH domain
LQGFAEVSTVESPIDGTLLPLDPLECVEGRRMDQERFSRFIRRAVDEAKNSRGWTVSRLAAETGVGRSTLFRWLAGDFQQFPELASVRGFCAALDIPVSAAFTALGVRPGSSNGTNGGPTQPPSTGDEVHRDFERILARLEDPLVPAPEKVVIRDMLRYLARRSTEDPVSTTDSVA